MHMVIVLAVLPVCAFMFAVYAIVRTEERHLLRRGKHKEQCLPQAFKSN